MIWNSECKGLGGNSELRRAKIKVVSRVFAVVDVFDITTVVKLAKPRLVQLEFSELFGQALKHIGHRCSQVIKLVNRPTACNEMTHSQGRNAGL